MIATQNRNTRHSPLPPLAVRRRQVVRAVGAAGRLRLESLEPRVLMSATWTNSDSLANAGEIYTVWKMAADQFGNVFASGSATPSATNTIGALLREKVSGSSTWTDITPVTPGGYSWITDMGVDGQGNLYLATVGKVPYAQVILKRDAVTGTFSTFAKKAGGNFLTVDAAGDLYQAFGGAVNKLVAGQTTWTKVLDATAPASPFAGGSFNRMTVIENGPSQGVYAVGTIGTQWVVAKSITGDTGTWSIVDNYVADASAGASAPAVVTGDSIGNVYVTGNGNERIKGRNTSHLITRKSSNGGVTWTISDDFQYAGGDAVGKAISADASGHVYVATTTTNGHAVIRSNVSGTWTTVDDYNGAWYNAITVDSNGKPYAGANVYSTTQQWLIRSGPTPAPAPAPLAAQSLATAPSITQASSTAPAVGSATASLVQLPSTTPASAPIATPTITTTSAITQETTTNASLTDPRLKALRPILN